jgi:hypothetical protein
MDKIANLDKLQRLDHDSIVRMESKLDGLIADVKAMGDGMATKVADHDVRLRTLENDVIYIGGIREAWGRFLFIEQQYKENLIKTNIYRVIGGFIGGLIFFILTQAPTVLRSWKVIK